MNEMPGPEPRRERGEGEAGRAHQISGRVGRDLSCGLCLDSVWVSAGGRGSEVPGQSGNGRSDPLIQEQPRGRAHGKAGRR